jgi:tRNA (mo5U34)-methyltransferase
MVWVFSFEAERRKASRVLATDAFCWNGQGWGTKAGFNFARKALHSKVEDLEIDVLDLSPEKVGQFDLVLFLGVLYHLRHPLLALERVFSVTKRHLILATLVDMQGSDRPVMAFYPHGTLGDSTNYWGPNPAAVEAMLQFVGFTKVDVCIRGHGCTALLRRSVASSRSALPFSKCCDKGGSCSMRGGSMKLKVYKEVCARGTRRSAQ